ncbi:MAG TPA: hypothetical protein VL461_13615, partial [Dictyobacter sp.]|nr:hypothetical protein [Dictyobacter sp.]
MIEKPEYTGIPHSVLIRYVSGKNEIPLWTEGKTALWTWVPSLYTRSPKSEDQLIASGYQRLSLAPPNVDAIYLASQLYDIVMAYNENNHVEMWAQTSDIERVKNNPVTLLFPLDPIAQQQWTQPKYWQVLSLTEDNQAKQETLSASRENMIPMLQYLPLPNIGEYGLVFSTKEPTLYHISQMPDQMQKLWLNIGKKLRDLAAPGGWHNHNDLGPLCKDEKFFHNLMNSGPIEDALRTKLTETHQHITDLRKSWQKDNWLSQWKEISNMVQELAEAYQKQAQQSMINKPVPNIAHIFNMDVAEIYTASPFQAYPAAAIARGTGWQEEPAEKETDLIISYARRKPSGTTYVQIREEIKDKAREAILANMWEQTKKLSDLDADVYLAMVAQMLKGIKDEEGNTWISAQQILDYRGILPKTNKDETGHTWDGGHRWKDIEEIATCIKRMENTWIKIQEQQIIDDDAPTKNKRKRPRKTISRESRLFMFGDVIYHNQLPLDDKPGRSIPIAWQYRQ